MDRNEIEDLLPEVDVLVVLTWPGFLTSEALSRIERLRFLQSILVGVNHIPFRNLDARVLVASNAGAYSLEVGEHAWALLLAAAKNVVSQDVRIIKGTRSINEFSGDASKNVVLQGKTFGILGYGGIGHAAEKYAQAFGMKVLRYGRVGRSGSAWRLHSGKTGLFRVLRESDFVLLSLPLTSSTLKMLGVEELHVMKDSAVLVNVARGDLVDQGALYSHLSSHPRFRYATDAWWFKERRETLETDYPLISLPNFLGTPHMSGPTSVVSGKPGMHAVGNVLRYLSGKKPRHLVDRTEYRGM